MPLCISLVFIVLVFFWCPLCLSQSPLHWGWAKVYCGVALTLALTLRTLSRSRTVDSVSSHRARLSFISIHALLELEQSVFYWFHLVMST